jgi:polyisoprenoid-binding protein YceI
MSENISNQPNSATTLLPASLTGVWMAEPEQSSIAFSVSQLLMPKLRGSFAEFEVTIDARENPFASKVTASIRIDSVRTGLTTRDHHAQTRSYFDAEKYPVAEYRSTGIRPDGDTWLVDGDLTLHGVTRPLRLTVASSGASGELPSSGKATFTATGEFHRRDFGISTGIPIVGDTILLSIQLVAVRQG